MDEQINPSERTTGSVAEAVKDKDNSIAQDAALSDMAGPGTLRPSESTAQPPKKPKMRFVLGLILALVLVAASLAVYMLYFKKDTKVKTTTPTAKQESVSATAQTSTSKEISRLTYAYKEGKKVIVRTISLSDKTKTELFSFNEEADANNIDYNQGVQTPNIDMNPEGSFAYTAGDGLYVGKQGAIEQKIKRSLANANATSATFVPAFELPVPSQGPGGPYIILGPQWSPDSTSIAFAANYYEGGGVGTYNVAQSKASILGSTFTYITPSYVGEDKLVLPTGSLLPTLEFGEFNFFRLNGIRADFVPGGGSAAAILCQPTATANDFSDCTKYPHQLASIDTKSGSITKLLQGSYDSVIASSNDLWYIVNNNGGTKAVSSYTPSTKVLSSIDLTAALKDQGEIKYVRVSQKGPYAEVYTAKSGGNSVTVVDLSTAKALASFDLANASAFNFLGTE